VRRKGTLLPVARRLVEIHHEGAVRERVRSLPKRFRRKAADGIAAEWELSVGEAMFTVSVIEKACHVREGPSLAPTFTVSADAPTWLDIDAGTLPPPTALRAGNLSVRGNLDMAVRMQTLFNPFERERTVADVEQVDVKVNGERLSTYLYGPAQGQPVLWLHGLGATKVSWLPNLVPFGERYRLIVPDLPGHGESDKPRTDYTPRFFARSMRKLLEAVGVEDAIVVGNSMGGRVALELAARSPDRVNALALLSPAVPGLRVRYLLGFMKVIPTEIGVIPFPVRERLMRFVLGQLFVNPEVLTESARQAAADEFIRIYRVPEARMAFFDSLRHLVTEPPKPFWARMERVRQPALVVWGEQDRLLPVRLAPKLAQALPNSELVLMSDVGHAPQFEATERINRILRKFLARF
jgi:pimeloyl-ACP methyl ester carboxylesterase/putative sterol carrier protein